MMSVSTRKCVSYRGTRASRKGLLDGAGDPPGFNAGIIDPVYSFRDVPVNLTLQLIRREFISNLRWNMLVFAQTVSSVPLQEQPDREID